MTKYLLPALAAVVSFSGIAVQAGGTAYPYLGASKYCEARRMGMSQDDSLQTAVEEAYSSSIDPSSATGKYNVKKMASLIMEECGGLWRSN